MSYKILCFFLVGKYDMTTPKPLIEAYFNKIKCSEKELIVFENSAHFPYYEEKELFASKLKRIKDSTLENILDKSQGQDTISTKNDFDFYIGKWEVRNERKMDDGSWKEFRAFVEVHKTLHGFGNVDFFISEINGQPYKGMTVRRYDNKTGKWYISWYDSEDPLAEPIPAIGGFESGEGLFYKTIETENGREVKVRFYWYDIRENSFRWESAWSLDGNNWNPIWKMQFKRR